MPSVKTFKKITPFAWKKPNSYPKYKILITRSSGTVDDITQRIFDGELIDGVTTTIGNFTFSIDNSSQSLRGAWVGNEIIKIYMDYATEATTLRFRGRLEQVSYRGRIIRIRGRSEGKKLLEITVTKSYSNQESSTILTNLMSRYVPSFTTSNVAVSSTSLTANWYQKPLFDCVKELCNASGFDFYVDSNLDCHYFESGTRSNTTEAFVHDSNLFSVGDFAYDYSQIKNRIIVYGGKQEGMDIIATAEDADSQSSFGVKELIINDNSITTDTQASERATYELSINLSPPLIGDVNGIGLPTLQPGEKMLVSAPYSKIDPASYKIVKYKHNFGNGMETTVTIDKEATQIEDIMRDRIGQEQQLSDMPNPNEMRNSWINTFDEDSGTHSSTEIINGVLKTDGGGSGTWISDNNSITNNAVSCELRANGDNLSGTVYYVSTDGGNTWQVITLNTLLELSPPGPTLKLKFELNSANTQIKAINLLYKN